MDKDMVHMEDMGMDIPQDHYYFVDFLNHVFVVVNHHNLFYRDKNRALYLFHVLFRDDLVRVHAQVHQVVP